MITDRKPTRIVTSNTAIARALGEAIATDKPIMELKLRPVPPVIDQLPRFAIQRDQSILNYNPDHYRLAPDGSIRRAHPKVKGKAAAKAAKRARQIEREAVRQRRMVAEINAAMDDEML